MAAVMMTRTLLGCSLTLSLAVAGCSSSDDSSTTTPATGGSAGSSTGGSSAGGSAGKGTGGTSAGGMAGGGAAGVGGKGGTAGASGKGGSAGASGKGGSSGSAGSAGMGGKGGSAGTGGGGMGGASGKGGTGGTAGMAGSAGTAGKGGAAGSAGAAGAAGSAGTGGSAGIGGASGSAGIGGAGGTAGSAGTAGVGGTGGSAGMGNVFPAPHAAPPQIVNTLMGPVLTAPKIVPVFFMPETDQSVTDITQVLSDYVASSTFAAAVAEYGVGAATVTAPVKYPFMPPVSEDYSAIESWLAGKLNGDDVLLPAADANTLYVLYYPDGASITINGGQDLCGSYGAIHDDITLDAAHGTLEVAFAVVPRCASFGGLGGLDALSVESSGVVANAVTDPFPQVTPAYSQVDDEHFVWEFAGAGEVGGSCANLVSTPFANVAGLTHPVVRTWSNAAAAAGHDPCIPGISPYFAAAPVLDLVALNIAGQTLMVRGVQIPVGQQKTVEIDMFSDADTGGQWTLKAFDDQVVTGGTAQLSFSFDTTSGTNGDKPKLTITALTKGSGKHYFYLTSTQGAVVGGTWIAAVIN